MKKILLILAVLLCLATAATFGAGSVWVFELVSHFRPHMALAGIILFLGAILLRHRAGAAMACVAFVVNALPLWGYADFSAHASLQPLAGLQRQRLLHFNMQHRYADLDGLRRLIEQERPDLVLLTEVPASAAELIDSLRPLYPHVTGQAGGSLLDVVMLSRLGPERVVFDRAAGDRYPVMAADLCPQASSSCVRVVGLHAAAPLLPGWAAIRNQQLAIAAGFARGAQDGRTLLVGDLNLTPWSPYFGKLRREGGLADTGLGRGLVGTWESTLPFIGLPIDHVLAGPGVIALDRRLGVDLNSDHRPLIVDFALQ